MSFVKKEEAENLDEKSVKINIFVKHKGMIACYLGPRMQKRVTLSAVSLLLYENYNFRFHEKKFFKRRSFKIILSAFLAFSYDNNMNCPHVRCDELSFRETRETPEI